MNELRKLYSYITLILLFVGFAQADENPFATNIRPTKPLTPAEEQKSFQLPPGFEVQLVAAEPDIAKPLNMAFDDRGRLWLTNSVEYPYAAPLDRKGRDSIKILEDTNGDGKADKITTFADGLNIPIGLYPHQDGVIVFSIPNIWHLRDTDNDGKADVRTKLYGPMGYRDTHGMNNAFRLGFDGWIYACHGFSNITRVQGKDGHVVDMKSGNTYRFRIDGSRIEHFTFGQVNPFGMTLDPWGNKFTADCHSKPVYQLLRNGYYPSFGKPHNGLGFVAPMMNHSHGSTAISGLAYYDDDRFPEEYQNNVFSGNVMTSRINRNSLVRHGATFTAKEETDFMTTSDPWFRPVDVQLGPDGAIYVADFYNRIIGHYEVPLDHPGRDRTSGRLWRIVHTEKSKSPRNVDLTKLDTDQLVNVLDSPNQTQRFLAMNRIVNLADESTAKMVSDHFAAAKTAAGRSCALWILNRIGKLNEATLQAAVNDESPLVKTHAMKVLSELPDLTKSQRVWAVEGLQVDNGFVQRAAADVLAQHSQALQVSLLIKKLPTIDQQDTHLRYVVRQSLVRQLQAENGFKVLQQLTLSETDQNEVAAVMLAIHTSDSASYLLDFVANNVVSKELFSAYMQHIARYLPADKVDSLISIVRKNASEDLDLQTQLFESVLKGVDQQGVPIVPSIKQWGIDLVAALFDSVGTDNPQWQHFKYDERQSATPWGTRTIASADGETHSFIDSRPGGERSIGRFRSPEFAIPEKLTFYLAGHRGFPDKPAHDLNAVQLIDVETGKILAISYPPRHDTAVETVWDLKYVAGRRASIEIVDGDTGGGYAWLAAGRFTPNVVTVPTLDPKVMASRLQAAASLCSKLQLAEMKPTLVQILSLGEIAAAAQTAIANAIISLSPNSQKSALVPVLALSELPEKLRQTVVQGVASDDTSQLTKSLSEVVVFLPLAVQRQMAEKLVADKSGATVLLELVEAGKMSPRLLQHPVVRQALPRLLSEIQSERVAELVADLPELKTEIEAAIKTRFANYAKAVTSVDRGRQLFKKQCAICHRIGQEGALVGPQLDGIGNRGLLRLLEDVLDPNRNVDAAFRMSTIILDNGKVKNGLFRRKDGAVLVFADDKGKEFNIPEDEIDEQVTTPLSLMPSGFTEAIPEQSFYDLVAFLLTQRGNNK